MLSAYAKQPPLCVQKSLASGDQSSRAGWFDSKLFLSVFSKCIKLSDVNVYRAVSCDHELLRTIMGNIPKLGVFWGCFYGSGYDALVDAFYQRYNRGSNICIKDLTYYGLF